MDSLVELYKGELSYLSVRRMYSELRLHVRKKNTANKTDNMARLKSDPYCHA